MSAFSEVRYVATSHAVKQMQRRGNQNLSRSDLEKLAREGKVILQNGTHRYVQNGDFRFPCIRSGKEYVIKSVIAKGMFMPPRE
jgi:hypothetical protein